MAATDPLKIQPYMKKWMAQAFSPKKASASERINGRLQLPSSSKLTHFFKEWTTATGVLKKIYCFHKNMMLQLDPLNRNCCHKLQ